MHQRNRDVFIDHNPEDIMLSKASKSKKGRNQPNETFNTNPSRLDGPQRKDTIVLSRSSS